MEQKISSEELDRIKIFLKADECECKEESIAERVKELVIFRFCQEMGITIAYRYNAPRFRLFANVVGEAVCRLLDIRLIVGVPAVRLVRYNHINLVDYAVKILSSEDLGEAFLDIFTFLEEYKDMVPKI